MPAVQPEFLPPDPYADATPSSQPGFLPPTAGQAAASPERQDSRAVWALIFGSGSLGLLVFSAGLLFFVTLPASIAGWVLGAKAKRMAEGRRDQANVAVIVAIVGCVLSVIAAAIWIALFATGQYSTSTQVDHGGDRGVHFDVIRLLVTVA
jgi:hypothetical protein